MNTKTEPARPEAAESARASTPKGVGETLARARCSVGLSVEDVAQQLKFNARQIEALEAERFGELPARVFARGMVRSYARLLKLDPEPLLLRVTDEFAAPAEATEAVPFRKPIPFSNSARRVNLSYALLSVAALVVIAAVAIQWPQGGTSGSGLSFVPATRLSPVEPAAAPDAARSHLASVGTPLAVATPEVIAPPPSPAPAVAAQPRITLQFARTAWVEVRGGNGAVLLSQLNAAGTTRVVEGTRPFSLVIGNAQHVKLMDGERAIDLVPYTRQDVARLTLE